MSVEVCLLLVEMYISSHQLGKASSRLEYLESTLFGESLVAGGNGQVEGEGPLSEGCWNPAHLHLFKARLHLLHRNIKACKKELKSFVNTAGNVSGPNARDM